MKRSSSRRGWPVLLVAIAVGALGRAADADAAKVALVVGNADYGALTPLRNSVHDAEAVALSLSELGFTIIRATNATGRELDEALALFRLAAEGSEAALFYFAGHGVQVGGTNYLLPVDASLVDAADLTSQALEVDRILEVIRDAAPDAAVIILDACRDNPLPARVQTGDGGSTALTSGLARVRGVSGVLIAYATAPGQVAYDGAGENSPFASALVQQLREPGLEVSLLFRRVRNGVMDMTAGAQIPWVEEALLQPLYLNPPVQAAAADPVLRLNAALADAEDPTIQLAAVAGLAAEAQDPVLQPVIDERLEQLGALHYQGLAEAAASPAQELADLMAVRTLAGTAGGPLAAQAFLVLYPDSAYAGEVRAAAAEPGGGTVGDGDDRRLWAVVGRTGEGELIDRFLDLAPESPVAGQALAARYLTAAFPAAEEAGGGASAALPGTVLPVFVGTGPIGIPLAAAPAEILVRSLPAYGVLTAVMPDGTRQDLTRFEVATPLVVAELTYTPGPAAHNVIDTFAVEPAGLARGLRVEPGDQVADAGAVTLHADVRVHDCDRLAGARFDTQGVVTGLYPNEIDPARAIAACSDAVAEFAEVPRFRYQLGRALTEDGQYEAAFELYREAAEGGHVASLHALGLAYQQGQGVERDLARAIALFEDAAEQGDLYGANYLGNSYRDGTGVARDIQKAIDYYIQAARGGHTFAFNNLGYIYLTGDGVPADPEAAYRLFEASAAAGDIFGFNNMGVIYERGAHVTADPAAAVEWYERAAAGGQPQAPVNLGLLYHEGRGVARDPALAAFWFAEAARLGNPWGYVNLGWMYQSGEGVAADPVRAAEFYARAVALGPSDAAERARSNASGLPRGVVVRSVQSGLIDRGYDPGPADGVWGRRTEEAVRQFLAAGGQSGAVRGSGQTDTLAVLGVLLDTPPAR